jgi:hypothetical protein
MRQLPIEASVDEFVETIDEQTGPDVSCPICGHTVWDTLFHTPLGVSTLLLRTDRPDDEILSTLQVVAFICMKCAFVRMHQVFPVFPPQAEESA